VVAVAHPVESRFIARADGSAPRRPLESREGVRIRPAQHIRRLSGYFKVIQMEGYYLQIGVLN